MLVFVESFENVSVCVSTNLCGSNSSDASRANFETCTSDEPAEELWRRIVPPDLPLERTNDDGSTIYSILCMTGEFILISLAAKAACLVVKRRLFWL